MIVVLLSTLITLMLCILIFWNFPWVLKYMSMKFYRVNISGGAIVVSDIHLFKTRSHLVGKLAKVLNIYTIVVAGDLFEEPPAIASISELHKYLKRAVDSLDIDRGIVIFVPTRSFHDLALSISRPMTFKYRGVAVVVIPYGLALDINECRDRVYVTHGDYLSRTGTILFLLDLLSTRLSISILRVVYRRILGIPKSSWVIYGHSHVGYIDHGNRVANSGSWKPMEIFGGYGFDSSVRGVVLVCRSGELDVGLIKLGEKDIRIPTFEV